MAILLFNLVCRARYITTHFLKSYCSVSPSLETLCSIAPRNSQAITPNMAADKTLSNWIVMESFWKPINHNSNTLYCTLLLQW